MTLSGAESGNESCNVAESATTCIVLGTAVVYSLRLSADAFQENTLTVTVPGTIPARGCPTVETQQLDVVLTAD